MTYQTVSWIGRLLPDRPGMDLDCPHSNCVMIYDHQIRELRKGRVKGNWRDVIPSRINLKRELPAWGISTKPEHRVVVLDAEEMEGWEACGPGLTFIIEQLREMFDAVTILGYDPGDRGYARGLWDGRAISCNNAAALGADWLRKRLDPGDFPMLHPLTYGVAATLDAMDALKRHGCTNLFLWGVCEWNSYGHTEAIFRELEARWVEVKT